MADKNEFKKVVNETTKIKEETKEENKVEKKKIKIIPKKEPTYAEQKYKINKRKAELKLKIIDKSISKKELEELKILAN